VRAPAALLPVGCMTVDFAMQNVLLQMGLSLVGVEGKRIDKIRTWVLRCHACFKYVLIVFRGLASHLTSAAARRICKDNSKKFCPACGNPTLLRTSVTVSGPSGAGGAPALKVHLKKNFQFRTRGTIYPIPAPKAGTAKGGPGAGLVLREDQTEFARAVQRADAKRQREERKMLAGGAQASAGSWMDPDWVPDILTGGPSGKGRRTDRNELPAIGYGRRNPNERRTRKK
jgi:RNA-binding protein NOB1